MKKLALLIVALAVVGCEKQGGTDDRYDTSTGRSSTNEVAPRNTPSIGDTNSVAPSQP